MIVAVRDAIALLSLLGRRMDGSFVPFLRARPTSVYSGDKTMFLGS
jgi:hypothetical protein